MTTTTSYETPTALDVLAMPGKLCERGSLLPSVDDAEWTNTLHSRQIRFESAGQSLM